MDVFFEQIIAKKSTGLDLVKKIGLVVAVLLIGGLMFILATFPNTVGQVASGIGFFAVIGAGYGAYYLISSMNVEYEYILTNGELDVDKIVARRKRQRLITANCREFTEFGVYSPDKSFGDATMILACIDKNEPNTYYGVVDTLKYGKCVIVFNPNEKILTHVKSYIRRTAIK